MLLQRVALAIFLIGDLATFVYLTFFNGYVYTWWNWIIVIPINIFLASIWPLYWPLLSWMH